MKVILNCFGLGTESLFKNGYRGLSPIPIEVIAGNEWDDTLRNHFSTHTPSCQHVYKDMRDMVAAIKANKTLQAELQDADLMTTGAPCFGRTVLREENNILPETFYDGDELFLLQLELANMLKPRRILSEMTPPNEDFNRDHLTVIKELTNLGYEVTVTDRFPSDLCQDAQHRERWIMVARLRRPGVALAKFLLEDACVHRSMPATHILDAPTKVPSCMWLKGVAWNQVFADAVPYPSKPEAPPEFEYAGGTCVSSYENEELTMLFDRIKQDKTLHKPGKPLILGLDTRKGTRLQMAHPLMARAWSIVHNICKRAGRLANNHDTYIVDLNANSKGLSLANAIRSSAPPPLANRSVKTFSVGCYTGGELVVEYPRPSPCAQHNIFRTVYTMAAQVKLKLAPHEGVLYNISSVCRFPDQPQRVVQDKVMEQANAFASKTLVRDSDGNIHFHDRAFTLARLNLSRSHYLGHLSSGTRKGFKVYSIRRALPTFTSYANILIYDDRDPDNKGVRLLSRDEIFRINLFSEEQVRFLRSQQSKQAYKYVANCIPPGMLHTIYSYIYDDLQQENESGSLHFTDVGSNRPITSGGDSTHFAASPNLADGFEIDYKTPGTSHVFSHIMGSLFAPTPSSVDDLSSPHLCNGAIDIDVTKKKHVNPPTFGTPRDTDNTAAIQRMKTFHRIYHAPNNVVRNVHKCCKGHRLKLRDPEHQSDCPDCNAAQKDKDYRSHNNPVLTSVERDHLPGRRGRLTALTLRSIPKALAADTLSILLMHTLSYVSVTMLEQMPLLSSNKLWSS